jgi:hypothetical protein
MVHYGSTRRVSLVQMDFLRNIEFLQLFWIFSIQLIWFVVLRYLGIIFICHFTLNFVVKNSESNQAKPHTISVSIFIKSSCPLDLKNEYFRSAFTKWVCLRSYSSFFSVANVGQLIVSPLCITCLIVHSIFALLFPYLGVFLRWLCSSGGSAWLAKLMSSSSIEPSW